MKKWMIILSGFLFFYTGNLSAQGSNPKDVIIQPMDSIHGSRPHSIVGVVAPTASLDINVLTIAFPCATVSQVTISQQYPHHIVYANSFSSSCQIEIDLEEEGVGEGSYYLWFYALGTWWWGEFTIENEN